MLLWQFFTELGANYIGEKISVPVFITIEWFAVMGKLAGFAIYLFDLCSVCPFSLDGTQNEESLAVHLL